MLILASRSPRRKELIGYLGIPFEICPSDADETIECPLPPDETVKILSARKAEAAACARANAGKGDKNDIILGVDTVVYAEREILGKPRDRKDATRMLHLLSGKTHEVFSGFTLMRGKQVYSECQRTAVHFAPLSEEEIAWYVSTGEPMDKAGAYGIQGRGGLFVTGIEGNYHSVMGLPVERIYLVLKNQFGVSFL